MPLKPFLADTGIVVGNLTVNSTILTHGTDITMSATELKIASGTANAVINNVSIMVSNATGSATFIPNQLKLANATISSNLDLTGVYVGNSSVNVIANGTVISIGGIAVVNSAGIWIANSTGVVNSGLVTTSALSAGYANVTNQLNVATIYATTSANVGSNVYITTGGVNISNATGKFSVGTAFIANGSLVNAAALYTTYANVTSQTNTGTLHVDTSANIAMSNVRIDAGGVNIINAISKFSIGTAFTANATLVNAAAIYIAYANVTGQVNTATLYATTSANVGSNVNITTGGIDISNSTGKFSIGTSFIANGTLVNAAALYAAYANVTGQINTGTLYVTTSANVGSNVNITTGGIDISNTTGKFSVGTAFIANATLVNAVAIYTGSANVTGAVNAATFNTTGLANVNALNVVNQTNTGTLYATTSANVGSNVNITTGGIDISNTTGKFSIGTAFIANATLVNAVAIYTGSANVTGQVNAATLYATTSANVGSNVNITTGGIDVSNTTGKFSIGTSFIANATLVNAAALYVAYANVTGAVNAASHYAGANVWANTIAIHVGNSLVNTIIGNTEIYAGNTTTYLSANLTAFKVSNGTTNTTLSVPTAAQWAATNYFLHANGSWTSVVDTTIAGGSDTYVQYNAGGSAFGGNAAFTYTPTGNLVTIANTLTVGTTAVVNGSVYKLTIGTNTTTIDTTGITLANTTNTITIVPPSTAAKLGSYYLKADGAWSLVSASGAKGGGTDLIFYENDMTVSTNYTLTTSKNAMTAGPVTVSGGVTVTVPEGQRWTVV